MTSYDTIDDAASAALGLVGKNKKATKQEFIGLIYQDPKTGKYLFTEPQGQGNKEESKGAFKVPKGSARAIYHNHPKTGIHKGDLFSSDDIKMSNSSGLLSYISHNDELKMYDPAQNERPMRRGVSGNPVIAQIAMDQLPSRRASPQRIATRGWTTTGGVLAPKSPPKGLLGGIQDKVTPDSSQKKVN